MGTNWNIELYIQYAHKEAKIPCTEKEHEENTLKCQQWFVFDWWVHRDSFLPLKKVFPDEHGIFLNGETLFKNILYKAF